MKKIIYLNNNNNYYYFFKKLTNGNRMKNCSEIATTSTSVSGSGENAHNSRDRSLADIRSQKLFKHMLSHQKN